MYNRKSLLHLFETFNMRPILTILLSLVLYNGYGTDLKKKADEIKTEAFKIYRSEKASWLGTDIMQEVYDSGMPSNLKGYFSYATEDAVRCVFYSNDSVPKILLTIEFDTSFNAEKTTVADYAREFSEREKEYYLLRLTTDSILRKEVRFFKYYKNTNYNIIPIIDKQSKRVYILTATTTAGTILFGNDYLLEFDSNNQLTSKTKLHNNLISIPTDTTGEVVSGYHTHIGKTSEFITPTDICTILLYSPYVKWSTYNVISGKHISIWSNETNNLVILSNKTLKKIDDSERKRKEKTEK